MTLTIRPPRPEDRAAWDALYAGYAAFYRVDQTAGMRDRVWSWLMTGDHGFGGRVADQAGQLVGLAHFRAFARPLSATIGGYLDDLYVDPAARGSGAAEALLRAVAEEGRSRGWSVIRWITAEDNYRARGLYDRLAERTKWVTYDIRL